MATTTDLNLPVLVNETAYRGDAWLRQYRIWWRDDNGAAQMLDTTGWTARMEIKRTAADQTPLLVATTENGRITTGLQSDPYGEWCLMVYLPGSDLSDALWAGLVARYDIELTDPSGRRVTFYYGQFQVENDVTRGSN